jgi:hypothetical protein
MILDCPVAVLYRAAVICIATQMPVLEVDWLVNHHENLADLSGPH